MEILQEFTCSLYSVKCKSVNLARLLCFQKVFSNKTNDTKFMKKVKNFYSSMLPPCWSSLKQKILRTIYVTEMWQNATDASCSKYNPTECGWLLKDEKLEPLWFEGDPTPLLVEDIVLNDEDEEEEEDDFSSDEEN